MKTVAFSVFIFACSAFANTQIIQSDCSAHDSIISYYQDDADRLTIQRINNNNYAYADSVIIPDSYSDTILNALIAIYNLTTVPERDTAITLLDIHAVTNASMNKFTIKADSNLYWMQNLSAANPLSGHPVLDSLVNLYDFTLQYYNPSGWQPTATVAFVTDSNYNLAPLMPSFDTITGVDYALASVVVWDGPAIFDTIYPTHVEITYRYSWGDCPAGCMYSRFWKFKVYYDCSVEFIESYGTPLSTLSHKALGQYDISIFPNPFTDHIQIKGISDGIQYEIVDTKGQTVARANFKGELLNLQDLESGTYFIIIPSTNGIGEYSRQIIKL